VYFLIPVSLYLFNVMMCIF